MGGQSSRILDHVKMANKDSEVMNTKLLKLIDKQGSDINYTGKVRSVIAVKLELSSSLVLWRCCSDCNIAHDIFIID